MHEIIADYVRTCDEFGLGYIREVMNNVRICWRKCIINKKAYTFSLDYSTHPKTGRINQYVHFALGGDEILRQTVEKNKMVWRLAFKTVKSGHDVVWMRYLELWRMMRNLIEPVISDNPLARPACLASDAAQVVPGGDSPQRTILTLKVEGIEKAGGEHDDDDQYYRTGTQPYKAWATIACPASLNFFQLHRAICLVVNCAPSSRTRETHEFRAANEAAPYDRPVTDGDCEIVQIGELYQVNEGKKVDEEDGPFVSGYGLRQRLTRTGAHYDTVMPLHSKETMFGIRERHFSINTAFACIHTTCINAVFREPNVAAVLVNGWGDYKAKFKVTCTKVESWDGPPPSNHRVNVMLAKCLRGKIEGDSYCDFSVGEANKRLHEDRGCLRRIMCDFGTENCIQQFPWAFDEGTRVVSGKEYIVPLAVQLRAMDHRPVFLNGEPPLPTSDEFGRYVSTLHGRIDPQLRQENIFDMTGDFAVPLSLRPNKYGDSHCFDCAEGCDKCIGKGWEKEADEEQERMDQLKPKKKRASGKKRKAQEKTENNPFQDIRFLAATKVPDAAAPITTHPSFGEFKSILKQIASSRALYEKYTDVTFTVNAKSIQNAATSSFNIIKAPKQKKNKKKDKEKKYEYYLADAFYGPKPEEDGRIICQVDHSIVAQYFTMQPAELRAMHRQDREKASMAVNSYSASYSHDFTDIGQLGIKLKFPYEEFVEKTKSINSEALFEEVNAPLLMITSRKSF